jgi:hypothetical protein
MAEAKESYAIDSYGRIFGITRKALINDDLGAFTDIIPPTRSSVGRVRSRLPRELAGEQHRQRADDE